MERLDFLVASRLTPKQKEFLEFIDGFVQSQGYAPSQQEIARHFGFRSLGTVQNYLVRLEKLGLVRKAWNARHGIEVVKPERRSEATELPLLGFVAAGLPIEAVENREVVEVPSSLLRQGEHFVLRVKGDSMIEEGIMEGDLAIIRRQASAVNGQTVVALVDNAATIKKYFRRGERIELKPANPAYASIFLDAAHGHDFKIEGVLVGLIRRLKDS